MIDPNVCATCGQYGVIEATQAMHLSGTAF